MPIGGGLKASGMVTDHKAVAGRGPAYCILLGNWVNHC